MAGIDARPVLVIAVLLAAAGLAGCTTGGTLAAVTTADPGPTTADPGSTTGDLGSTTGDPSSTTGDLGSTTGASTPTPTPPSMSSSTAGTPTSPAPAFSSTVVPLQPGASDEASGIAASTHVPGDYFLIDDASGTDEVVIVSSNGAVVWRFTVGGMSAGNAEALASGSCGATALPDGSSGQNCLYVGDIGDNSERREDIAIFRFAEPDPAAPPEEPVASDEWRYTYPDGPQNAEAMLAAPDGSLLVVTKPPATGALPHRMYRAEPGGGRLVFIREFSPPPASLPLRTMFTGNVVTDLASSPGRVLLLTYDEVQQFTAPDPAADISTFPDWPHQRVPAPSLSQAEGIASAPDGCGYTIASEAGPGGSNGSLGVVSCG